MELIINSVLVMFFLSLGLGLMIAIFAKVFEVKQDPRIEKLIDILPSYNCGACGYTGCENYAEAIINNGEDITKCSPGGKETIEKIKEILAE